MTLLSIFRLILIVAIDACLRLNAIEFLVAAKCVDLLVETSNVGGVQALLSSMANIVKRSCMTAPIQQASVILKVEEVFLHTRFSHLWLGQWYPMVGGTVSHNVSASLYSRSRGPAIRISIVVNVLIVAAWGSRTRRQRRMRTVVPPYLRVGLGLWNSRRARNDCGNEVDL